MIAAESTANVTPLSPSERPRAGSPDDARSDAQARRLPTRSGRHLHLDRTKGLCMNCELRLECAFPVPEGGVWHCEEYA